VKTLIILSNPPYDGSDIAWNALRLAGAAVDRGHDLRLFLINDGVDAARPAPEGAEFALSDMVTELTQKGAEVLLCGTCMNRCGLSDADAVEGTERGSMDDLVTWMEDSDRVVSF
jgi:uncharacterized protein involved in oxidation of intracellular sulfur